MAREDNNEEILFGKMVGASLMKLSKRSCSLAKLKIRQVLYEMEEKDMQLPASNLMANSAIQQNQVEFRQQSSSYVPPLSTASSALYSGSFLTPQRQQSPFNPGVSDGMNPSYQ